MRRQEIGKDPPFVLYAMTQDTLDGSGGLCGYTIDGPGADSFWLLSAEQVEPTLRELRANLAR